MTTGTFVAIAASFLAAIAEAMLLQGSIGARIKTKPAYFLAAPLILVLVGVGSVFIVATAGAANWSFFVCYAVHALALMRWLITSTAHFRSDAG